MKVILCANTSWYLWNFRRGLIKELLERGWNVILVMPDQRYSKILENLGCKIVTISMDNKGLNPLRELQTLWQLYSTYRKHRPMFAYHFTVKPTIYGSLVGGWLGVKCINTITGLGTAFIGTRYYRIIVSFLYRRVRNCAHWVFFQNKDDQSFFVSNRFVRSDRTSIVPGAGIDLEWFDFSPCEEHSVFRFLFLGRLLTDKGLNELAIAAASVKSFNSNVCIQLLGPLAKESRTAIKEKTLSSWVENDIVDYLGTTDDVREYIRAADCVVLPSYREGTPRSLLEAAAIGRPIIASDVPGCREVVENAKNGFLCRPRDSKDLAKKMCQMLGLSLLERGQMGGEGRKIVERRFAEKIVIDQYIDVIEKEAA